MSGDGTEGCLKVGIMQLAMNERSKGGQKWTEQSKIGNYHWALSLHVYAIATTSMAITCIRIL